MADDKEIGTETIKGIIKKCVAKESLVIPPDEEEARLFASSMLALADGLRSGTIDIIEKYPEYEYVRRDDVFQFILNKASSLNEDNNEELCAMTWLLTIADDIRFGTGV